jgi:hypothetical protein
MAQLVQTRIPSLPESSIVFTLVEILSSFVLSGRAKGGDVQDVYERFSKLVQSGRMAAQIQAVLQNIS